MAEENKGNRKQEAFESVTELFQFFLDRYQPAAPGPDALKKTTSEIFQLMQEHCPSPEYDTMTVYNFLMHYEFKYETPGGNLEFVWLLKYKAPAR